LSFISDETISNDRVSSTVQVSIDDVNFSLFWLITEAHNQIVGLHYDLLYHNKLYVLVIVLPGTLVVTVVFATRWM